MLIRFLIILALTYAVFFLLRWLLQGRKAQRHGQRTAKEDGNTKRKGKLVRDPKTGEYRPQRDDEKDGK